MDYKIENTAVYPNKRYQILSGSTLKLIALIVMFIDHVGAVILLNLPELGYISEEYYELWYRCYRITRNIGRSAFPIFCFLLVEGFCHTHSKAKYALRLFAFALISQIPYSLAIVGEFSLQDTNVFFTLLLGLLTIWGMSEADRYVRDEFLNLLIKALCVATGCMTAYILKTDYDYQGILLIAILYIFRFWPVVGGTAGYVLFLTLKKKPYSLPGFLVMQLYNGKKGKGGKYGFYIFYPAHLLILYLIRQYIL